MKNILFITMLLGVGYSECNEDNWQEYYPNMAGCDLEGANLYEANLKGVDLARADLQGVSFKGVENLSPGQLINAKNVHLASDLPFSLQEVILAKQLAAMEDDS